MLGVTNDQNYNDIADALREVGADLSEETFTPSEMAPAIRGLRSRWGNIEGDIANQTDLQNALNSKADSADLGTMSEEDDAPSDDKQYGRKNGDWVPITDELANWGQIAGNIADQTDLKNALDAKADAEDLGTMSEEDDAPSDNKQYGRKNGDWVPITDELANWGQIAGNLSDQTDLKNVLDEKLEAHDTELTGSIVTFEAENDHAIKGVTVNIDPVQDLHGYSNPWPAGGGKNLLGVTAVTTTANGLTFTVNAYGTVKVNGTATAAGTFPLCGYRTLAAYGMVANQTYILSGTPSGLGDNCYLMFGVEGTASPEYRDKGSGAEFQPSDLTIEYRAIIVYTYGTTLSNVVFQPMIRKSTEDASWAPYENICPITGWDEAVVTRTGKNLLDASALHMFGTSSKYIASSQDYGSRGAISVKPSTVYTFSCITADSGKDGKIYAFNSSGTRTQLSGSWNRYATITTPSDCVGISFYCRVNDIQTPSDAQPMLELGSTATSYEPYNGTSVTIDLDDTRYGGTLDVLTGEMTVDRAILSLKGRTFSRASRISGTEGYYFEYYSSTYKTSATSSNISYAKQTEIFTHGSINNPYTNTTTCIWVFQSGSNFVVRVGLSDSTIDTVEKFSTWLNNQTNIDVVYPLATPLTVQLTPEQLSSLIGTNHLWADTGDSTVTLRLPTGDLAYQDTVDYETQVTNKPDFGSMLSGSETSMVATKNYAKDSLIAVGDDLYKATSAIASGSNIVVGSNAAATTIEAELALKANSSNVYTKTQTDTLLNAKANSSSVYTKTETDDLLDEKLDTAPSTDMTGDIVTFDAPVENAIKALSVAIDPVQDLHGYDNPWPAGGGANQWDEQWELGGLDDTTGEKVVVTTQIRSKNYIPCQAETSYYVASATTNISIYVYFYGSDYTFLGRPNVGGYNVRAKTITTPSGCAYMLFKAGALTTYNNDIAINYPSTVTTYQPYSNICPISGHDTAVVTRTGKNLYNPATTTVGVWLRTDNGQTESAVAYWTSDFITVKAGESYFATAKGSSRNWYYDKYKNPVSYYANSGGSNPFVIPSGISFIRITGQTATIAYDGVFQFELSSSATSYEPYNGTSVTIDLDGTRYGGTLDVLTGEMTVDVTFKTLTGDNSEGWSITTTTGGYSYFYLNRDYGSWTLVAYTEQQINADPRLKCNIGLVSYQTMSTVKGVALAYGYLVSLPDFLADDHTVEEFRTYLASNPIQIVIPLKTPLTVQLSPEQLSTLIGTNHVLADTGDVTLTLRTGAGRMAYQDTIDYSELTGKPDFGTMSEEDDAPEDSAQYARKDGEWIDLAPTLNDKADVITETKSGSIVSISDGAEAPVSELKVGIEPVQDLHGYDSPWPAGGGVNVMPPLIAGTYTADGITAVVDANGKITVTGTKTTSTSTNLYLSLSVDSYAVPNGYYVHIRNNQVYSNIALDFGGVSPTLNSVNRINQNTSERTPSSTFKFFFASILVDTTFNFTLQPSVEATSTVTDWTPYSNICPISGWDEAVVTRTGKNLLDCTKYSATTHYNGVRIKTIETNRLVAGSANEDGRVGTWTRNDIKIPYIKGPITITFSGKYINRTENTNATIYLRYGTDPNLGGGFWSDVKNISVQGGINSIGEGTFSLSGTIPEGAFLVIGLSPNSTASAVTLLGDFEIYDLQVELSSTATEYEETNIQQVTIDLDGTRYGGTLNVLTGEMRVTHGMHTVSSSDTIGYGASGTNSTRVGILLLDAKNDNNELKCNLLATNTSATNGDIFGICCLYGSDNIYLMCRTPAGLSSNTERLQWLVDNNCIFTYPLASPFTVQLTPEQLTTLLGTNNIWSSTGDTEVTYRADSKMYIDQKVDEAVRKTKQVIAAVTDTMVAPSNLTAGDFIIVGNDLIKATSNVASGATLTIGSNCVKTTVAEALIALASA